MTTPADSSPFWKLEALGNDFVLVDLRREPPPFPPEPGTVRQLAQRRTGIGFDQLLVLRTGETGEAIAVDIFNADGGSAEQCGNGMRAIAAWMDRRGELGEACSLETPAGRVRVARNGHGGYTAALPAPHALDPEALGVSAPDIPDGIDFAQLIGMGNPHLVLIGDALPEPESLARVTQAVFDQLGWRNRVNVGLAAIDGDEVVLRVHERGAGPTLACGSGACAAAWAAGRRAGLTGPIRVRQPGGTLVVDLHREPGFALTGGPARVVFEGRLR